MKQTEKSTGTWESIEPSRAKAVFPYEKNGPHQLSLAVGDEVQVTHYAGGWYKGFKLSCTPPERGIFPASYVKVVEQETHAKQELNCSQTATEPFAISKELNCSQTSTESFATSIELNCSQTPTESFATSKKLNNSQTSTETFAISKDQAKHASSSINSNLNALGTVAASSSINLEAIYAENENWHLKTKGVPEPIEHKSDSSLFNEIEDAVKSWRNDLRSAMANGQCLDSTTIRDRISQLSEWHRVLTTPGISVSVKQQVREHVDVLLECTRELKQGWMLPKNENGQLATLSNTSLIGLYKAHKCAQKRIEQGVSIPSHAETQPTTPTGYKHSNSSNSSTLQPFDQKDDCVHGGMIQNTDKARYSLVLELRDMQHTIPGSPSFTLFFSLWALDDSKISGRFVSEEVSLVGCDEVSRTAMFTGVQHDHIEEGLYLICRVYQQASLISSCLKAGSSTPSRPFSIRGGTHTNVRDQLSVSRPFGVSVWPLSPHLRELPHGLELVASLFSLTNGAPENCFARLHEKVIVNNCVPGRGKNFEVTSRVKGIVVGLQLHPEVNTSLSMTARASIESDYVRTCHLGSRSITSPSRCSTVVKSLDGSNLFATDSMSTRDSERNELYITLVGGTFSQDRKRSQRNVQCRVYCLGNENGQPVDTLSRGVGYMSHGDAVHGETMGSKCYTSSVLYHCNNPEYCETIRLQIPQPPTYPEIEECHLVFVLYHISTNVGKTNPFAFAFLRLSEKRGVVIDDRQYELPCYKPFKEMESGISGIRPTYLLPGVRELVQRPKDVLLVQTKLCSSLKTQKEESLLLLNWQTMSKDPLVSLLDRVTHFSSAELLANVVIVLRSILSIFEQSNDELVVKSAFQLFVIVANVCSKAGRQHEVKSAWKRKRAEHEYDSNKIRYIMTLQIRKLFEWLEQSSNGSTGLSATSGETLTQLINTFPLVLDFLCSPVEFHATKEQRVHSSKKFQDSLTEIVYYVDALMMKPNLPLVTQLQSSTLERMSNCLCILSKVFDEAHLGEIVRGFLESVHCSTTVANKSKLEFLLQLVQSTVMLATQARKPILSASIRLLQSSLGSGIPQDFKLCVLIIHELVGAVQHNNNSSFSRSPPRYHETLHTIVVPYDDNEVWMISILLPEIVGKLYNMCLNNNNNNQQELRETIPRKAAVNPLFVDLLTSAMFIVLLMSETQRVHFMNTVLTSDIPRSRQDSNGSTRTSSVDTIDSYSSASSCTGFGEHLVRETFVEHLVYVLQHGVSETFYPKSWKILLALKHQGFVAVLRWLHQTLISPTAVAKTTQHPNETRIWTSYFCLGTEILCCLVAPATLSDDNDSVITTVCNLLEEVWNVNTAQISEACVRKVSSSLVGPILRFAICGNHSIRPMFRTLFSRMLHLESSISQTHNTISSQSQVLQVLEELLSVRRDTNIKLHIGLADVTAAVESLFQAVEQRLLDFRCIQSLKQNMVLLATLLRELTEVPRQPEFEDTRVSSCLKLLSFLRTTKQIQLHAVYSEELCGFHISLGNYAEAGNVLLMHNSLVDSELQLTTSNRGRVVHEPDTCHQTERMLSDAVHLFKQAGLIAKAIQAYDRLRSYHEGITLKLDKVCEILDSQSGLFKLALKGESFLPSFFRVGFFGASAEIDTNNWYIYRALPFESLLDFKKRLELTFRGSYRFVQGFDPNSDKGKEVLHEVSRDDITIFTVTTVTPTLLGEFDDVPKVIQDYQTMTSCEKFTSIRSIRKREVKSGNDALDNWAIESSYYTADPLPSVQRRALIVKQVDRTIHPVELATSAIKSKNAELASELEAIQALGKGERVNNQTLTMLLNGVVDAAVNGGIANYIPLFDGTFHDTYPEISSALVDVRQQDGTKDPINQLRLELGKQIHLVRQGLRVHGSVCPVEVLPLHEYLLEKMQSFEKLLLSFILVDGNDG